MLAVGFSPDGRTLVAGTDDGLTLWRTDTDTVTRSICSAVGQAITTDEWRLYLPGRPYRPPCLAG